MMQPLEQKVWDLIREGVEDLDLRLVRVHVTGGDNTNLQIMVEPKECTKDNPVSVNVDDCASVSRMASALLDVEDPIVERYTLEVSSTGLERPLVTMEDFMNYSGCRVKLKLCNHIEGKSRFTGILLKVESDEIYLNTDEGEVNFPYSEVKTAKLRFTDAEINQMIKTAGE